MESPTASTAVVTECGRRFLNRPDRVRVIAERVPLEIRVSRGVEQGTLSDPNLEKNIQKALDAISIEAGIPTPRIPKPQVFRALADSTSGTPTSIVRDYLARKEEVLLPDGSRVCYYQAIINSGILSAEPLAFSEPLTMKKLREALTEVRPWRDSLSFGMADSTKSFDAVRLASKNPDVSEIVLTSTQVTYSPDVGPISWLDPLEKQWVVIPRVDPASEAISLHFKRVWG